MLLNEISEPFDSDDYVFELKFDGVRAIIFASPKGIKVMSRNKKDMTNLFPELSSIKDIVKGCVVFDGEIVSLEDGVPSFDKLKSRLNVKNRYKIDAEAESDPVEYIAFDILYRDKNLVDLSLIERKRILEEFDDTSVFKKSRVFGSKGTNLFKEVKKRGLEGIVAKLKVGTYHIDERTSDFIKIKNIQRDAFLVGGYIENPLSNTVSLLLGEKSDLGLVYVGKVLMGKRHKLYEKIQKIQTKRNPFVEKLKDIHFVKPILFCEVEYLERTKSGHLRHPVYRGEGANF